MDYIYEMPEEMLKECAHKGTVERFEYDTFTYDEVSEPLHKGAQLQHKQHQYLRIS